MAIARIPRRRAVRMIRRAISPRLAMSSESIMGTFLLPALEGVSGGLAQQVGPAPAVDLATQERGGVHQAERRVGQHPRLSSIELRAQGRQYTDPLLDVQPLQPADLPFRLLRQAIQLMQVQ